MRIILIMFLAMTTLINAMEPNLALVERILLDVQVAPPSVVEQPADCRLQPQIAIDAPLFGLSINPKGKSCPCVGRAEFEYLGQLDWYLTFAEGPDLDNFFVIRSGSGPKTFVYDFTNWSICGETFVFYFEIATPNGIRSIGTYIFCCSGDCD